MRPRVSLKNYKIRRQDKFTVIQKVNFRGHNMTLNSTQIYQNARSLQLPCFKQKILCVLQCVFFTVGRKYTDERCV